MPSRWEYIRTRGFTRPDPVKQSKRAKAAKAKKYLSNQGKKAPKDIIQPAPTLPSLPQLITPNPLAPPPKTFGVQKIDHSPLRRASLQQKKTEKKRFDFSKTILNRKRNHTA